ncbi:MAG: AAA-like domain-containing protein [Lachnospiraceae bacterium]|nr:AAA-like domain-containing protein [Lachnospiraceae bacterium]
MDRKKVFNVTGACDPQFHYMVDIQGRLKEIRKLVDAGAYFTINRARQYGKTTTLNALKSYLSDSYVVAYMDFQMLGDASFENEYSFVRAFVDELLYEMDFPEQIRVQFEAISQDEERKYDLRKMFRCFSEWCSKSSKPVVLMIDEVDRTTNNQVFVDFLSQLRGYYIRRGERATFQSVILAGVYDVKNIRRKIRAEEDHRYNSPWNIATDFKVDMSFSADEIEKMLISYEKDCRTGMDVKQMAALIFSYTSGYPFLVSRLCQMIDEVIAVKSDFNSLSAAWTKSGLLEAVKLLISEKNALYETLANKLNDYEELRRIVIVILFEGKDIPYNSLNPAIDSAEMFGFVKNEHNRVVIANRIFETVLYNLFLSEEVVGSRIYDSALQNKNQFIMDGHLNMRLVLEKFVETFHYLYGDAEETFVEETGRKYFMLFLKPIINGVGNCYVEAQTRSMKRTDLIVDYQGEQFIIELKIWRGQKYHDSGEEQAAEYLDFYQLKTGYILIFNFNKKKEIGVKEVWYGDRLLIEATV